MNNSLTLLESKYPRYIIRPGTEAHHAFEQALACVRTARRRTAVKRTVRCEIGQIRAALLDQKIPFITVQNPRDPFLAIFPSELEGPRGKFKILEKKSFTFTSHPFTDSELEVLDNTIPFFEQLFGETVIFMNRLGGKLPKEHWEEGMALSDSFLYRAILHPFLLQETARLVLHEGDLICDPACGSGELLFELRSRFPGLRLVGSDVNESVVRLARVLNPAVPLAVAEAQLELGIASLLRLRLAVFSLSVSFE